MKKTYLALAVLALSAGNSAFAQTVSYNPSWYAAPSVNVMDQDDLFGIGSKGKGAGLRFGKPVSQDWDIQFGPTFSRASNDSGAAYRQNTLGVDGLLMLSRNAFRPFLLLGAGAQYDRYTAPLVSDSKTSPYLNAGLGFQWAFNDTVALQADLRHVHGFVRDNAFGGASNIKNNYLNIGLNFAFDKPPAPAPVVHAEPAPAPAPAPAPTPAPAPRFERVTLSATDLFAFNSAVLSMPQPKLDEIADVLRKNPDIGNVTISGYTDRLGSKKYNLKLSQKRAEAVKDYLVGKGVDASRLKAVGHGKDNPVATCDGVKKRAELIKCLEPNRRVEVEQITVQERVQ